MLIAQEKRKTNIAEYILYMWQVEDLIRAYQFNMEMIENHLISQYTQSERVKEDVRDWYANLMLSMHREGIKEKGHLQILTGLLDELTDFHVRLLNNSNDADYRAIVGQAEENLRDFRSKLQQPIMGDVEVCLNALYGLLLLRLKKQSVSPETEMAMVTFSRILAALSKRFLETERGEREL
jgi:hypothetical protein